MIPDTLAPTPHHSFIRELKNIDSDLKAIFNCNTERWEIHRYSRGRWHWVIAVENDNGSFRPLDRRIFKKLHEMDIIARWGSIANYEKHLDEKQKQWQEKEQKRIDHELRYDIKDDKYLWQRAAENFKSGIINDPPYTKEKKVFSFPKEVEK